MAAELARDLRLEMLVSPPFQENSYILWRGDKPSSCIVVDPGFLGEALVQRIQAQGAEVEAILNTHGHADHIAGNKAMKEAYPKAPLLIGTIDAPMLTDPVLNLSKGYGLPIVSPAADRTVEEGEILELLGMPWEVRHIPGHSPGHVVFVLHADAAKHGNGPLVLGGDVLFQGSIGRFDFPGGSEEQLLSGIRAKLYTLPDETVVYPGHGDATTIGEEKRTNPFVRGKFG